MTPTELGTRFTRIRPWSRNGERAVHKPPFRHCEGPQAPWQSTGAKPVTFAEIEPKLKELLADFGRPSAVNTPHNPFWHMQSDGIWQLEGPAALLARPMGATPNITELRDPAVQGSFTPELVTLLDQDPQLIHEIAHHLVEVNFPASIAQDVLDATGIPPLAVSIQRDAGVAGTQIENTPARRRRDPAFREKVLVAYEYRCCICGYDLRLGRQIVGVEAAHIR